MSLPKSLPSVIYFYGLAGAGKNFVGNILGKMTGWPVYHADSDLTPDMLQAILEKRVFTDAMRDRFYEIVGDRILQLRQKHEHLIVTQATYKRRHRDYLMKRVPDMEMVWVCATDAHILERLQGQGGEVPPDYAARIKTVFEPPMSAAKRIDNDAGEGEVIGQLKKMYAKLGEH